MSEHLTPIPPAAAALPRGDEAVPSRVAKSYRQPSVETRLAEELRAALMAVNAATGFIPNP
jgi:hypothetical protein